MRRRLSAIARPVTIVLPRTRIDAMTAAATTPKVPPETGSPDGGSNEESFMETMIVVAVVVLVGLYGVRIYNGLVSLRTRVEEAWSDIQVQMKRRYDLIPNLVETVKGYASHERDTLEAVVRARNAAVAQNGSPEQQAAAERAVAGALGRLFALAEAYPDLKADQNFRALQDELVATEEKLNGSRRFYNGSVRELNVMVEQFPSNLIAGFFKFAKAQFFELDEDERAAASKPVRVSFD